MKITSKLVGFLNKNGISRQFMVWIVGASSVIAGLTILSQNGIIQKIYESDSTKITALIGFIFFWQSIKCGFQIWEQCQWNGQSENGRRCVEKGWLWSDIVLSLGMIGTVIGFMLMLAGFAGVEFSDVESVQNLIAKLSYGMSTSLSTTLFGLVSSVLLKLQFFHLEKIIENKDSIKSLL